MEPYYKKISRRTHAEIATDLGVVTDSSWNNITGKKWFKTDDGNDWDNNTLRIQGINGHDAGLTFFRDGIDVGQLIYNGYSFSTQTANGVGYIPIKSSHFIKNGSDENHVLLGDGNDKPISDFVLSSQLGNYIPYNGAIQDVNLNQKDLLNSKLVQSQRFNWYGYTSTPIGKVTTESAFHNLGTWGNNQNLVMVFLLIKVEVWTLWPTKEDSQLDSGQELIMLILIMLLYLITNKLILVL